MTSLPTGSVLLLLVTVCISIGQGTQAQPQLPSNTPTPPGIPGMGNFSSAPEALKKMNPESLFKKSRSSRAADPPLNLEDSFKEFASKLGKTPDEMRAAFGKFIESKGITMQQIQENIKNGHQAVVQMVESIKRAMQS